MGKKPNKHFSKEEIQITKRYMKRCLMLLIIREIQVKTTMMYQLTPARIAIIKKQKITSVGKVVSRFVPCLI